MARFTLPDARARDESYYDIDSVLKVEFYLIKVFCFMTIFQSIGEPVRESKKSKKKKERTLKGDKTTSPSSPMEVDPEVQRKDDNSVVPLLPSLQQRKDGSNPSLDELSPVQCQENSPRLDQQSSSIEISGPSSEVVKPLRETKKRKCQDCDCLESLLNNLDDVREEIELKIYEKEKEYKLHQKQVSQMIELQSRKLSRIISDISVKEDEILKGDKEIQNFEFKIAEFREAQKKIALKNEQNASEIKSLEKEKKILEEKGETKIVLAKKQGEELDKALQQLNNELRDNIRSKEELNIGTNKGPENTSSFVDFLSKQIKEKEADLECPVCLETAEIPIYCCQQMHLICSNCRPKLSVCPECRVEYQDMRRHRYAEKTAEELKNLREMVVQNSNRNLRKCTS